MNARVLLVDDDADLLEALEPALNRCGFSTVPCRSAEQGMLLLDRERFDVVIADVRLSGMNGIDLCARVKEKCTGVPVIVASAFGNLDTAAAAIRAGAHDFIAKPFDVPTLDLRIRRALLHRQVGKGPSRRDCDAAPIAEHVMGRSLAMQQLRAFLERVAACDASVLITGETGTGKEVVARALHLASRRSAGRFVAVHCASIPESLLESELFGHVKGAITGARLERPGLFESASDGTLFLDEVTALPLGAQTKLVRAIQERSVHPIGGTREVPVDVRILASATGDLQAAVLARKFREDLYARLNVLHVELPPLRARQGDIAFLARSFVNRFRGLDGPSEIVSEAIDKLLAYPWPGNVRELVQCIEHAVAAASGAAVITSAALPKEIREHTVDRKV